VVLLLCGSIWACDGLGGPHLIGVAAAGGRSCGARCCWRNARWGRAAPCCCYGREVPRMHGAAWIGGSVLLAHLIRSPAGEATCMVRVDAPAVWLRPGTMVVLSLGQCSAVPCRHGARQDMVVRAAFGRLFMDMVHHAGVWLPVVSARCSGLRRMLVLLHQHGGSWWWWMVCLSTPV
jgi:hypothetical protein